MPVIKRRTQTSINRSIFEYNTAAEAQMENGVTNAFEAQSTVLEIKKINYDIISVPLATSQHHLHNLASCCYL